MAIIVDKVQKRADIALAAKPLFLQKSFAKITISEIAKSAGIGKGTVYEYFKNKEDVVFEIINILLHEHNHIKHAELERLESSREKIKRFFAFFYAKEDQELRELYREFLSIALTEPNEEIQEFQTQCYKVYKEWFESIIDEGIAKGELVAQARAMVSGIFVVGDGMFIRYVVTNDPVNLESEINTFFDALFDLIEVKK